MWTGRMGGSRKMDPMTVMWISLTGIGLMVVSALMITIARAKTRGFLRGLLSRDRLLYCWRLAFSSGVFSIIV